MRRFWLAAGMTAAIAAPAGADIRIAHDTGGNVESYQRRVEAARFSGERVVIDGLCGSACTMWVTLPASQVCATARAILIFHTVTDSLTGAPAPRWNDALLKAYPPNIRRAILIKSQGSGLWFDPIRLRGIDYLRRC